MPPEPSPSRSTDPRPQRTRARIEKALEELAAEGAEVTVKTVVARAGVSRSAFYAQFAQLEDAVVSVLLRTVERIGSADAVARLAHPDQARPTARTAAESIVAHIDHRRAFYRASLDWPMTSRVQELVVEAFAAQIVRSIQVLGDRGPAGLDVGRTALFIAGGMVAVLTARLRETDPVPASVVVRQLLDAMPEWLVGREDATPGPPAGNIRPELSGTGRTDD